MQPGDQARHSFLETMWDHYARHGREALPWRQPEPDGSFDPYKIMVSELMLQQTQVPRVIPKYAVFLEQFPTTQALAKAELGDVLRVWQGLGYNRRAKFLWQAAQMVDSLKYFPDTPEELVKLPGVGRNTAGAILAYAHNRPVVFVETNVRTVYIHHFFHDHTDVADKDILSLVEQTLDYENPREFYWALMDYGSHLKASVGNLNKVSRHYTKQSTFHGSRRQIRGQVIRLLGSGDASLADLQAGIADERLADVLKDLVSEGLIRAEGDRYSL
jgi:A/G-specific adenine glycosylase